jgi:YidC/Oxa1 family membrane protein insertase
MWDAIREALGTVLAFFYSVIPNSGVAIILLTVTVRLVLFPLTAKQAKSMLAMQRVQPEIKKLQAKYKNDRQKLNEEMMKFYKENEINPLGGCLPLVIQMPVFIALYQTLEDIQKFIPTDSKMFADICHGARTVAGCKTVKGGPTLPDMKFAGMNLTRSAAQAASHGIGQALPYLVLVGLVVVTGFVQQRQTMRTQTSPNPQMAIIGKVFPIVFAFISWSLPSGVGLYFATSNLWQVGQQEFVFRTIGTAAGPPKKKKGQAALEGSGDDAVDEGGGTTTATRSPKPLGGKGGGGAARSGGGKTAGSGKGGGGSGKGSGGSAKNTDGQSSNGGQARTSGSARSNRKRKR